MKRFSVILAYFNLAVIFFVAPQVKALEITIDPGAVGTSFTEKMFSFNDFNNTIVSGQTLTLDFVFNDMKYITPEFNNDNPNISYFYDIVLLFDHNLAVNPGFPPAPSGFLSDEYGSSILGSDTSGFYVV